MTLRLLPFLFPLLLSAQPPGDLNFLAHHTDYGEIKQMLPRYLRAKAERQLDARRAAVSAISSQQQLDARRKLVREKLLAELGGFPARTPLNTRVTGTLDFPTHKVEKIIFESQPGFFVTANLYLPKSGVAPHPAILFPLGHEQGAKAHEAWQYVLVTFAKRGYVCLAWDTIGQGERIQHWDDDFQDGKLFRSTTEHTMLGLQTLLNGDPLARYTIWDGMRALDYLLSRPEVDPKRVGVTGNSGGGTHTAYLAALDDRFAAIAPSCYITSWSRLLATIGPQDAEQCIPPFLADGLDHGDFILAAAPKPYLMLTAIRDFFSIEGARATYAEVQRVYDSIGLAQRFGKFEADDGHGYLKPRRLASYRFFSKYFEGREDTSPEPDVTILPERDLWATANGHIGGETVYTLNRKRSAQVRQPGATLASVRQFTNFDPPKGRVNVIPYGAAGHREKLVLETEPGIKIPALRYSPSTPGPHPAVILAYGQGKASAHADAEKLVSEGNLVLSLDLRGLGETRHMPDNNGSDWPRYFGDYESAMTALLTGKPLVIMRAEDISRAVDLLADSPRISLHAKDLAAVPALYAAAFDNRIAEVTLDRMVVSYESILRHKIHRGQWENAVAGALRHYDLPDLIRWTAPRKVNFVQPLNPLGQPVR